MQECDLFEYEKRNHEMYVCRYLTVRSGPHDLLIGLVSEGRNQNSLIARNKALTGLQPLPYSIMKKNANNILNK